MCGSSICHCFRDLSKKQEKKLVFSLEESTWNICLKQKPVIVNKCSEEIDSMVIMSSNTMSIAVDNQ